jgi:hypothetical protein
VNDQHVTAITSIVQAVLLLISATLVGAYLWETRRMRQAAERQAEAPYFPAVGAKTQHSRVDSEPLLENIDNGPAMEVQWFLPNSKLLGSIAYLEAHSSVHLGMNGLKPLYEAPGPRTNSAATAILRQLSADTEAYPERPIARAIALNADTVHLYVCPRTKGRLGTGGAGTDSGAAGRNSRVASVSIMLSSDPNNENAFRLCSSNIRNTLVRSVAGIVYFQQKPCCLRPLLKTVSLCSAAMNASRCPRKIGAEFRVLRSISTSAKNSSQESNGVSSISAPRPFLGESTLMNALHPTFAS